MPASTTHPTQPMSPRALAGTAGTPLHTAPSAAAAMRLALALTVALVVAPMAPARAADGEPAADDATRYVQFVEVDADKCVSRNGVQIQVKSTHPSRRIRVWMDRTLGDNGTGDRSRSDLAPGAEPEPLGCSRNGGVAQGWRMVRAVFLD
jgi:hypothetical protein